MEERTYLFYHKDSGRYLPTFSEELGALKTGEQAPVLVIENMYFIDLLHMMQESATHDGWIHDGAKMQQFLLTLITGCMPGELLVDLHIILDDAGIHCLHAHAAEPAKKPGLLQRLLIRYIDWIMKMI